jgi:beta-phosphoglucomutase-like phosphatase (HAD superfamily)
LVDDSAANVRAARAAGFDALQFTGVTALARDLSARQLLRPAP